MTNHQEEQRIITKTQFMNIWDRRVYWFDLEIISSHDLKAKLDDANERFESTLTELKNHNNKLFLCNLKLKAQLNAANLEVLCLNNLFDADQYCRKKENRELQSEVERLRKRPDKEE